MSKFHIKNRTTIVLDEDLKKGTEIDLTNDGSVVHLDINIITEAYNSEFNEKLNEQIEAKRSEMQQQAETKAKLLLAEKEKKLEETLRNNFENKLKEINAQHEIEISKRINETKQNLNLLIKDKDNLISKLEQQNKKQNEEIIKLSSSRPHLNSKNIGEGLEQWCLDEFNKYQSAGAFNNCSFIKDNKAIKDENDIKGSKADFIFKYFNKNQEVAVSACLEMKAEAEDSTNKKKNSDYYDQLHKNRNKKECEFAILVTELEKEDDFGIQKVNEYPNMYKLRPQYLIAFLATIIAIQKRVDELENNITKREQELSINYASKQEIEDRIQDLKDQLINTTIKNINKNLETIISLIQKIQKNASDAEQAANTIKDSHIKTLTNKIEQFDLKQKDWKFISNLNNETNVSTDRICYKKVKKN